jgi:alpha-ketoglutarate-dependent taurine dioxygenase
MKLLFCCLAPAISGGETPLAWTAEVTRRIGESITNLFAEKNVLYVRNYGQDVDLAWETVFQTESRAEVEAYCRRESIDWDWLDEGRLRTRQVCQGVAEHPVTGQRVFFNQAHLFHVSSLGAEVESDMVELYKEPDLPRNAYFGDDSPIDRGILDHIRASFEATEVVFPWERGDLLLVDNMLVAHGRRPFRGPRQVVVSMGDPFRARRRLSLE